MKIQRVEIKRFKGLEGLAISDLSKINVFVGKNNAGKSSILHAIDMMGLALENGNWDRFQPKLEIKDLISDLGEFKIEVGYKNGSTAAVQMHQNGRHPEFEPKGDQIQKFRSILIWPDVNSLITGRRHMTPDQVWECIQNRNFAALNGLQIMHAIKFFGDQNKHGLTKEDYQRFQSEIMAFFPEIDKIESSRTGGDIDTLLYTENGQRRDIIYSGSGIRQLIDILVKIVVSGADVILLDEPETGLHPDIQRKFVSYLNRLVSENSVQIFVSTHSPVFLNDFVPLNSYRITNVAGTREVAQIANDAIHTVIGDLGLRPSDVFNRDICVMVEGADDVAFYEHIFDVLYASEFEGVSVAVLQYGGDAAAGIVSGSINVSNIVPAQGHVFWIRDRDARPADEPSSNSTKFANALNDQNMKNYILKKREVEFYYPEVVLENAQQGKYANEQALAAKTALNGDQGTKFRDQAKDSFTVPRGKVLRSLLAKHVTDKSQIEDELRTMVEEQILPWKDEILG